MSEQENKIPVGLERLTSEEKKLYDSYKDEFIAVAQIYEAQGVTHGDDGMFMMPIPRVETLKNLVQKTGLSFEQMDVAFRHALQVQDMITHFFPDAEVPEEEDEIFVPSERPDVENEDDSVPHSTLSMERDQIRHQMDTMILSIRAIREVGVNSPHLRSLCLEITNLCRPFGGIEKYTGDADFSQYVHSVLTASADSGKKSREQQKTPIPTPAKEAISVSSRNSSENLRPGETTLQKMARKIGELFRK